MHNAVAPHRTSIRSISLFLSENFELDSKQNKDDNVDDNIDDNDDDATMAKVEYYSSFPSCERNRYY